MSQLSGRVARATASDPEVEVVDICRDLIRIHTSNYGDGSGPGEREAAEYVAVQLAEVGLEPELVESAPGAPASSRASEGRTRRARAARARPPRRRARRAPTTGQVHPFSGEVVDGCVWGRGAVDMKDMDAMILAIVRDLFAPASAAAPRHRVAFLADEEAGGPYGATWIVHHRRDLIEGVTEAVSEVGGFSTTIAGRRAYLLQTAEKGLAWLRLVAHGRAGHGSQVNSDNAVNALSALRRRNGGARAEEGGVGPSPSRRPAAARDAARRRLEIRSLCFSVHPIRGGSEGASRRTAPLAVEAEGDAKR